MCYYPMWSNWNVLQAQCTEMGEFYRDETLSYHTRMAYMEIQPAKYAKSILGMKIEKPRCYLPTGIAVRNIFTYFGTGSNHTTVIV